MVEKVVKLIPDSLKKNFPKWVKSWWGRRIIKKSLESRGAIEFSRDFVDRYGAKVRYGPFEGLVLPEEALEREFIVRYILGTHEWELHNVLREIKKNKYEKIINIGTSVGYYTVGLARVFEDIDVYGFDSSVWAQKMTKRTAFINDANNVKIKGGCTLSGLRRVLSSNSLIVCDCEGCEFDILRPDKIEGLRKSDILVELHGHKSSKSVDSFVGRYENTHKTKVICYPGKGGEGRSSDAYPELENFARSRQNMAVSEFRATAEWLYAVSDTR